jgi:hypothetical protein
VAIGKDYAKLKKYHPLKETINPGWFYVSYYQLFIQIKTGLSKPVSYFYHDIRIMTFRQQSPPGGYSCRIF